MTPGSLLVALHEAAIAIHPHGDGIGWEGPKGAMTLPLAAALNAHKALILKVFETFDDKARDVDWDTVRDWIIDDTPTFTTSMLAAARRILPVSANAWPEAYAHFFRDALRVRALLRVFRTATDQSRAPPRFPVLARVTASDIRLMQ